MITKKIQRRFVSEAGRRVHFRRVGEGPPLVMLHGSPGNSAMLEHEMQEAATQFTCFAFDTPGFGDSDPLPGDTLTVGDLARAIAEAMAALGLSPCPIFGTHTGAAIALELGALYPECTTGLILEGVPIFTPDEMEAYFSGYFEPMVADPLAGHLISTWVRFRDQFTWFPWTSRHVTRLNPLDRPTPDEIDLWVSMFYRSCRTYRPAYRAACHYGQGAIEAARRLTTPAVFFASAEDMLYLHLDRLPPLKANQRIERLPYDSSAKMRCIANFAASFEPGPAMTTGQRIMPVGSDPAVQFLDIGEEQVFVRCYGKPFNPPFILLHDAPGSGLRHQDLARSLAMKSYVVLPDLPGNGDSDSPRADILEASVAAVISLIKELDLSCVTVGGLGCGATAAALLAKQNESQLFQVLIDDMPERDEAVAASIAPDLPLSSEGAHWVRAWLMIRDGQIYSPWFDGRVAAQRKHQGNFDANWLHDQTVEIMKSRQSYHRLPRAAWQVNANEVLAESTVPIRRASADSWSKILAE